MMACMHRPIMLRILSLMGCILKSRPRHPYYAFSHSRVLHFGVNKITKTISIMILLDSTKPVTSLAPEATDAPDTTESVGITADLYQIALGLIVSILSDDFSSRFTAEEETSLRRTRQRLFLWGDGHSILAGRMDEALEQATDLRRIVIATLRSIIKLVYLGL
jgi:hypothetical protein